ncbi:phage tail protein [Pseudomonas sp. C11]|uniref:phage tail protein n=1 Tax=Pseudomonas sp. C11 TaxID=3075550 RepID=UPI002AFDD140|nr:tail fiber protein [Pseudomonas sp. C11]
MEPFVGEITLFAFDRAPLGWLPCNGQILNIKQYNALFSLLGSVYGGDGKTTFGLPDLRGRVAVNQGTTAAPFYTMGLAAGSESVTLTTSNIPLHTHTMYATNLIPSSNTPKDNMLCNAKTAIYAPGTSPIKALDTGSMSASGSSTPHENRQPSIALQFCIATIGIYPPRG